ncbi:hypothetical protein V6N13_024576 [Hibiscus sabdariffa]
MCKQILKLVMEDAIDDWLLRQIYWLRREDIVSQGIRWIQDMIPVTQRLEVLVASFMDSFGACCASLKVL